MGRTLSCPECQALLTGLHCCNWAKTALLRLRRSGYPGISIQNGRHSTAAISAALRPHLPRASSALCAGWWPLKGGKKEKLCSGDPLPFSSCAPLSLDQSSDFLGLSLQCTECTGPASCSQASQRACQLQSSMHIHLWEPRIQDNSPALETAAKPIPS